MAKRNYNKNSLVLPPAVSRNGRGLAPLALRPGDIPLMDEQPSQPFPIPTIKRDGNTLDANTEIDFRRGGVPTVSRPPLTGEQNVQTDPALISENPFAPPTVSPYARRQAALDAERDQLNQPITESKDSRLRSGLEAIGKGLEIFQPKYGMVRNWDELFSRLGAVPGAFVGGLVNDKWDEQAEQQSGLARNQTEQERLDKRVKTESDSIYNKERVSNMQRDDEARTERDRLNAEDKSGKATLALRRQLLSQINTQQFYKKGVNAQLDAQLAKAEIEIADFDNTKKDIVENGVRKRYNAASGQYEQIAGTEVDPDDVPINVKIGGVPTQMSVKEMNKMLFQQGLNQFNQGQQNVRQSQSFDNSNYQMQQRFLQDNKGRAQTYIQNWQRTFAATNGRMPTAEEAKQELSNWTTGQMQPQK